MYQNVKVSRNPLITSIRLVMFCLHALMAVLMRFRPETSTKLLHSIMKGMSPNIVSKSCCNLLPTEDLRSGTLSSLLVALFDRKLIIIIWTLYWFLINILIPKHNIIAKKKQSLHSTRNKILCNKNMQIFLIIHNFPFRRWGFHVLVFLV